MSYKTLEVDLENGHVLPRGTERLPLKARALLTIVECEELETTSTSTRSLADRLEHLAGIGRGEYTDLSSNKEHMADFGQ